MELVKYETALIVGAGEGLSAALARLFTREGIVSCRSAREYLYDPSRPYLSELSSPQFLPWFPVVRASEFLSQLDAEIDGRSSIYPY